MPVVVVRLALAIVVVVHLLRPQLCPHLWCTTPLLYQYAMFSTLQLKVKSATATLHTLCCASMPPSSLLVRRSQQGHLLKRYLSCVLCVGSLPPAM